MKRNQLDALPCPVARSLDAVGDCWSLLIIRDALLGKRRFGEFHRSIGVAKNILSQRLGMLVEQGILTVEPASDGSAFREYVLTQRGQDLHTTIVALRQWGEKYLYPDEPVTLTLVDKQFERTLVPLAVRSRDGRTLAGSDCTVIEGG